MQGSDKSNDWTVKILGSKPCSGLDYACDPCGGWPGWPPWTLPVLRPDTLGPSTMPDTPLLGSEVLTTMAAVPFENPDL